MNALNDDEVSGLEGACDGPLLLLFVSQVSFVFLFFLRVDGWRITGSYLIPSSSISVTPKTVNHSALFSR